MFAKKSLQGPCVTAYGHYRRITGMSITARAAGVASNGIKSLKGRGARPSGTPKA